MPNRVVKVSQDPLSSRDTLAMLGIVLQPRDCFCIHPISKPVDVPNLEVPVSEMAGFRLMSFDVSCSQSISGSQITPETRVLDSATTNSLSLGEDI